MPFTEDYHRTNATHAALEWLLIQVLKSSPDPKAKLEEFKSHMDLNIQEMDNFAIRAGFDNKQEIMMNANAEGVALSELKDILTRNVQVK